MQDLAVTPPNICNLGQREEQNLQLSQFFQMHEPGVRDIRVLEDQYFKVGQFLQMSQTGVADFGGGKT